jgi:hypothetical protein
LTESLKILIVEFSDFYIAKIILFVNFRLEFSFLIIIDFVFGLWYTDYS